MANQTVLANLRLSAGEGLCHAAALLFARHPHRFVSSAQVQCGRFRGTTSVDFLIVRECEAAGIPRPEFLSEMGTFIVRFTGAPLPASARPAARRRQVVAHVIQHGTITRPEYQVPFGLAARQANEDLSELVRDGVLLRSGSGRGTRYVPATGRDAGRD